MKRILFSIALLAIIGCQQNNPQPNENNSDDCNDFCKCGEITFITSYQNDHASVTFTNNCTGNKRTEFIQVPFQMGETRCFNECW